MNYTFPIYVQCILLLCACLCTFSRRLLPTLSSSSASILLSSVIALISLSLQLTITIYNYLWITSCKWKWSSSSSVPSLWSVWVELLGAGSRSLPPNYLKVEPARWITNYNLQITNHELPKITKYKQKTSQWKCQL